MKNVKYVMVRSHRGLVAAIAVSMSLMMTLCGCSGFKDVSPKEDKPAVEETASEEQPVEEVSSEEESSEEPVVIATAYFEENNIEFTDETTFTAPFAVDTYDPDTLEYKEYKGVTVKPADNATITLGDITPAKCDKEGYKAYTIEYTVKGDIRVTVDTFDYDENYSYEPQFPHIDMADYYTGTLLTYYPSLERHPDGKNKYDYIDPYTFNGKNYELAYFNLVSYGESEETDWRIDDSADDSRMQWYDVTVSENHSIEIRVPEDYDGLVLAINLNGVKEYDKEAYYEYMGSKDRLVFDEDTQSGYTYKPNASKFIRLSLNGTV